MARNLLLVLVLANLLAWGWHRWVAPRPVADPAVLQGARDPQLVLLQTSKAEVERSPPVATAAPSAAAAGPGVNPGSLAGSPTVGPVRCLRLGPFPAAADARRAAEKARTLGLQAAESSEAGEIWVGHWVQVAGLADRAAADDALAKLARAGLADAYIVASEPDFRLSLGVFRARDGADSVAAAARRAGFEPVTTDRLRPGTEHWLTVAIRNGPPPELASLAPGGKQILRFEGVDCPASLGGSGGD